MRSLRMNNVYLLERLTKADRGEYAGFVVLADSETEARHLASGEGGSGQRETEYWLDPVMTSCELIDVENDPAGIILSDFNAG